jgi:transcriptional regulator with XRE-family HTH domain
MEHLTKSQFAQKVGVSAAYISQLIKAGKLKTVEKYGTEVVPLSVENLKNFKK